MLSFSFHNIFIWYHWIQLPMPQDFQVRENRKLHATTTMCRTTNNHSNKGSQHHPQQQALQQKQQKSWFQSMSWHSENVQAPRGPVSYDSSNWTQILFQMHGSLWPRVLPYCILNAAWMVVLTKLHEYDIADLGISGVGHGYAGVIVSFLVVSRINTSLSRYNECRGYLGIMYRETRELLQTAYILTRRDGNLSRADKDWRAQLAYRALVMLRAVISVVEYNSTEVAAWDVKELSGYELDYVTPADEWRRYRQTPSSERTDSMRVPLRLCFLLRETIASQKSRLATPLAVPQELKLLGSVDGFMNGWYGMRKFLTTPVPFPLIQMTRTIVLIYVFTLPLIFLKETPETLIYEHCAVIFLLTYGFVSLELVSIESDDPFGDDDNDFDCYAYARVVFEDSYLMINDTDGQEYADIVRRRMNSRAEPKSKRDGDLHQSCSESTELLSYHEEV